MTNQAYPLHWPAGWPETPHQQRTRAKFQCTLEGALGSLKRELDLLGAKNLLLSSNYTLGAANPDNPGVVAYFNFENDPVAIPCDRWNRVEHNVRAIALTIEAMRGMDRWGAKHMIKAMFRGFKMLPSSSGKPWHEVLHVPPNANSATIVEAYRTMVKRTHPDKPGGRHDDFVEVNTAYETAKSMGLVADEP